MLVSVFHTDGEVKNRIVLVYSRIYVLIGGKPLNSMEA